MHLNLILVAAICALSAGLLFPPVLSGTPPALPSPTPGPYDPAEPQGLLARYPLLRFIVDPTSKKQVVAIVLQGTALLCTT